MRSDLTFLATFAIAFVVTCAGVLNSTSVYSSRNPYATVDSSQYLKFSDFSATDRLAAKLYHASSRTGPYDIGIFGNSRSVMLHQGVIPWANGRSVFNFSVGGTSLHQSVRSIEFLAAHGVLPRTVVVSVDPAELQFVEIPYWPHPLLEPLRYGEFLGALLRDDYDGLRRRLGDVVKVNDFFLDRAWQDFERLWNFERTTERLAYGLGFRTRASSQPTPNYLDGSRRASEASAAPDLSGFKPKGSAHRADARLTRVSIERLSALARATGARVIVYEAPLAPSLAVRAKNAPSAGAVESRRWLREACAKGGVECYDAPVLPTPPRTHWPDCCHAPASILGAHVDSLLRKTTPELRQ
jgi:hypothetical protein